MRGTWLVLLVALLGLSGTLAAQQAPPVRQQVIVKTARAAVRDWLNGKYAVHLLTPQENVADLAKMIERYAAFSPPPRGVDVNLEAPEVKSKDGAKYVLFPATVGSSGGNVAAVVRGGKVVSIAYNSGQTAIPVWVQNPVIGALFALFSLLFVLSLSRPGEFGRMWHAGWALVRQYWKLYLFVNLLLYGLYILGSIAAYGMPDLARAIQKLVAGPIAAIGIEQAARAGLPSFALGVFYWNFSMGALATTAIPGLLLGIPALLFNAVRYYVMGFALSPVLLPAHAFLWHLPTLAIELQGYILVTFGAMVLLTRVMSRQGYRSGFAALVQTVFLAAVFLLVGAWYEALELQYLVHF